MQTPSYHVPDPSDSARIWNLTQDSTRQLKVEQNTNWSNLLPYERRMNVILYFKCHQQFFLCHRKKTLKLNLKGSVSSSTLAVCSFSRLLRPPCKFKTVARPWIWILRLLEKCKHFQGLEFGISEGEVSRSRMNSLDRVEDTFSSLSDISLLQCQKGVVWVCNISAPCRAASKAAC